MIKHKEMLFADLPKGSKTTQRSNSREASFSGARVGVRTCRTEEEAEKYRSDALKRRLP